MNLNNTALGVRQGMNDRGFRTGLGIADLIGSSGNQALNLDIAGRNALSNRAYNNALALSDLTGQNTANRINLMGTNAANQMNLLGQLGQAQAASTIAQGQNSMNSRLAGINLLGNIGAAYAGGM